MSPATPPSEPPAALRDGAGITDRVARHVLWHYGEQAPGSDGMEPGAFVRALLRAFALADAHNRIRLGTGFPDYYLAFWLVDTEGPDALREVLTEAGTDTRPTTDVPDTTPGAPA